MNDWLDAESHADRAFDMYERGRWAEAEAELRKAIALNPDQPDWHFNLGLTLEASGRDAEAMRCFERAIELLPGEIEPLLAAASVANRLEQFETALARLDEVIRIDSRLPAAYAQRMESLLRLGNHEELETTYYLVQQLFDEPNAHCLAVMAESLIERSDFERAGWCLREALRHQPNLPRLRARLGAVYAATGHPQRALHLFLRELRDDPGNIDTLLDYGELLVDLGRLPEAAEKFRRVLELEPANLDAHYRLGQIAMTRRRFDQAHLEFELVLKLDDTYPDVRVALAEALLARGLEAEARDHLRAELDRVHGGEIAAASFARLGAVLLDASMAAEAAPILSEAIQQDGDSAVLQRRLALARFRSGDRDGGVAASRRVLRLDPRCVVSMHNLALAALEEGRLRAAAGWIRRGLRVDRHDTELRRLRVRVWLAWVREALRRVTGIG